MALGKKTGGRDFKPGDGGRKKGSRDKIPRSFKASVRAIFEEVASTDPEMIRAAITKGLAAPPPKSFSYLQLMAHYLDGKPREQAERDHSLVSLAERVRQLTETPDCDPRDIEPPMDPEELEADLGARARPEAIEADVQQARETWRKDWTATPDEIRAELKALHARPEVIEADIQRRQEERLKMRSRATNVGLTPEQASAEAVPAEAAPPQVETPPGPGATRREHLPPPPAAKKPIASPPPPSVVGSPLRCWFPGERPF